MSGTRIELCALLLHIEIGDDSNTMADRRELVQTMQLQQATIRKQQQELLSKDELINQLRETVATLRQDHEIDEQPHTADSASTTGRGTADPHSSRPTAHGVQAAEGRSSFALGV